MHTSRMIAVGAGGAASWIEDLVRAGLGQFVLIDPDEVGEANLATQQTYRRGIGRPKVDCIAELGISTRRPKRSRCRMPWMT